MKTEKQEEENEQRKKRKKKQRHQQDDRTKIYFSMKLSECDAEERRSIEFSDQRKKKTRQKERQR